MCAQHETKPGGASPPRRHVGVKLKQNARRSAERLTLKEARSGHPSRRTETGYEAAPTGASGHMTAKPLRPKDGGVNPEAVDGRRGFLPGEVPPYA